MSNEDPFAWGSFVLEPFTPDTEQNRSFRTHSTYVAAFRTLALGENVPLSRALKNLHRRAQPMMASGQRAVALDRAELAGCLDRAWSTELILATTRELAQGDVVRLATSWGTVQAYYAMCAVVQAVLVAEGRPRPEQHEQTQKQFLDLWPRSSSPRVESRGSYIPISAGGRAGR